MSVGGFADFRSLTVMHIVQRKLDKFEGQRTVESQHMQWPEV